MTSVLLDPFLIAVPDKGSSRSDVESYVRNLLNWARLRHELWVELYLSKRALECLYEEGCFPLFEPLRSAVRLHAIDYADPNTLATVVNWLIEQTPHLEDRFGVSDVLSDTFTWDPDLALLRPWLKLTEELQRALAILGLLLSRGSSPGLGRLIATRSPSLPRPEIRVRAMLACADEPSAGSSTSDWPVHVEETFLLCASPEEFLAFLDPVAIWTDGQDEASARVAIRLGVFARAREEGRELTWEDTDAFILGGGFYRSANRCGFGTDGAKVKRLLRAAGNVVLGLELPKTHALRESASGGAPPRQRGTDKAMRRDIDHEYHLHYWDRAPATPELANVVTHNDFVIDY